MHIPKLAVATAVVTAALGFASPVMAQHHRGGGDGGGHGSNRGESHAQAAPRSAPQPAARPAPAPPPAQAPAQRADNGGRRDAAQPRAQGNAVPRGYPSVNGNNGGAYRSDAYRNGGGNRSYSNSGNRYYGNGGNRYYGSGGDRNYSYRGYG